jgi:tRNA G37 N-methylase Trm5
MKTNHCEKHLNPYNMDGRDFVLSLVDKGVHFTEAIMNLPQNATDFLDVFIGLAKRKDQQGNTVFSVDDAAAGDAANDAVSISRRLPRIHVYAFSTADDPVKDIAERSAGIMQCDPAILGLGKLVSSPTG